MGVEEEVDEQSLDGGAVVADLAAARRCAGGCVLEAVEGLVAGQRRASRPARRELTGDRGQYLVVVQRVVVDQILVAQRQGDTCWPMRVAKPCSTCSADR